MSIRESLSRIPSGVRMAVLCVFIVALGIYTYGQLDFGTGESELVVAEEGVKTTLKCSACGHTFERETAELQRMGNIPGGSIELTEEGATCPECGELRVRIVEKPAS